MSTLAPILQSFFTERLHQQRQASAHTIATYRDAIRLLVVYAADQTAKAPSVMDIADLDVAGDPDVLKRVQLQTEIVKLEALRAAHLDQQVQARWELKRLPQRIADLRVARGDDRR